MSAIERQIKMLQMIPRSPRKIDSASIVAKLSGLGYEISIRSVQRDLIHLSIPFQLLGDEDTNPRGWSYQPDAPMVDIPSMDPVSAFTFRMVEEFLYLIMPPVAFKKMKPYFSHASKILDTVNREHFKTWPDKVKILSRSQPLSTPNINESILETVYESLLEGKRFSASYKRKGEIELIEYSVNPIGIVVVDSIIYLVCTLWNYNTIEDVRQLAIHRIFSAKKLDDHGSIPDGFNIQKYIDSGAFGYPRSEQTIKLKAVFAKNIAFHLQETALSDDQVLTDIDVEKVMVEASVLDTAQLRWWLLGFGEKVEIMEPVSLRAEFKQTAEKMHAGYSSRQ